MTFIQLTGAFELGLVYSLVALGVYLSFRVLQFPDMTVDGTFPLGASVCAALMIYGVSPIMATLVATLAGGIIGLVTSFLSTRLKMLNLLAGILSMTALYSINLRVMGRPNISLLGEETLFSYVTFQKGGSALWPLFFLLLLCSYALYLFLNTEVGLAIRATGSNSRMARANGINDHRMIGAGLGLSNAFVAFAGSLYAQVYGFADVTMGVGKIVEGLAAIVIGEAIFPTKKISHAIVACMAGALVYRFVIALSLNMSGSLLQASDLNFITAVLVGVAMLLPSIKGHLKGKWTT